MCPLPSSILVSCTQKPCTLYYYAVPIPDTDPKNASMRSAAYQLDVMYPNLPNLVMDDEPWDEG